MLNKEPDFRLGDNPNPLDMNPDDVIDSGDIKFIFLVP